MNIYQSDLHEFSDHIIKWEGYVYKIENFFETIALSKVNRMETN
jgi:hypothetical protein